MTRLAVDVSTCTSQGNRKFKTLTLMSSAVPVSQITELLDDERCEAECEELPQDGEEGPASSDSPQHTHSDEGPAAR